MSPSSTRTFPHRCNLSHSVIKRRKSQSLASRGRLDSEKYTLPLNILLVIYRQLSPRGGVSKPRAYREALKTLLIPIFLSTEQAMECGSPSQHQATHDVDSNTVRLEQRREKRVQHGTQAQSRHAIAVNARGGASICSS